MIRQQMMDQPLIHNKTINQDVKKVNENIMEMLNTQLPKLLDSLGDDCDPIDDCDILYSKYVSP